MRLFILLLGAVVCVGADSSGQDSSEWGIRGIRAPKTTTCPCGWSHAEGKRIVNGKDARLHQFPWIAGLMSQKWKIVLCGGTIITPYHVITAAHCTLPMKDEGKAMAVVVGEHDLIRNSETNATQIINVVQSIEHEGYRTLAHQNDIALLVLEKKIEFHDNVGPACLPTKLMDLTGQYIRVIGWGRTSTDGTGSNILQKVNLKVIEKAECNKKLPVKLPEDRQFCTYRPKKDSCRGDSGGPLVWVDPETNRYTLVGLVSFGVGGCATDKPGVNTNVSYYLDWIKKAIKDTMPQGELCTKK